MSKIKPTFLDRLVSFVSPQAGVQRLMAKKALTKFEYDAVKYTRERRGPSNLSGAEDYRSNYDRVELMKRARDLAENNGLVRSILLKFASHVAANITYQARTDSPKANTEIETYWNEWFDNCDLSTRHTGSTLMQVATISMLRDGDFLFVLVRDNNGNLKLQGIEADRLGDPYKTYTSLELIGGIHIDRNTGAPTAYDIYNRSIGDFYTYQVTVQANQAFHYFDPLRIDQYRGISAFHTAINDATDIYDIVNFEKLAAKVASSQSAIVKRTNNNASDLAELTTEQNFDNQQIKLESMEAGKVSYLEPGEDIVFPDGPSRPSGAFAEFHKILLRNICMGLGIPYSFAVDPSAMSGPTARLEMQQAGRTFKRYQKLLDDKVLRPLKNIVIADAVARGIISGNGKTTTKGFFNFGANVSIDLGRESASAIAEFKAGLRTASDIYSERGMDVEAALRARAIETKMIQDLAKEYGVPPQAVSEILLPTGQPQAQAEQTTQDGQQVEGQPDLLGQSLNGAQVASLINVINAVAAGALSKEGAVSVITAAFPSISREQAMGIVAGVQSGKIIPTTEKEKQAAQDGQQDEGQGGQPVPQQPKPPVSPTGLEELKCPTPTQDIKLNLQNRQTAVDKANYGPANPNEPNEDYWKAKANEFQGDVATAKKMLCGNCAAFNQTSKLLNCIKQGIGEDANEVAIGGDLGYCEIFDFKCAAKRTCDAWIVGGPITDKKKEAEQALSSLSHQELKMLIAGMMGGIELGKYDGIDFTPPEGARIAAKRALAVREQKPASQKGMTPVGIARARDLINGVKFSPDTIRRMKAFFDRHEVDKKGSTWNEQGKGWQAWNGWGGDAGYAWARKVVRQMDSRDEKLSEFARPGPKSAAQTPAPEKERIKGSEENKPGSAATKSTGGKIEIGEGAEEAIKNKLKEWKDKNPGKKAPSIGTLKKVFRRGAGAYSTSFRPTIGGGKPNSRNAWALARVSKFLVMAGGGKVKESYRKADGDLLEAVAWHTELKAGDGLNPCGMKDDGTFDDENDCATGYGRPKLVGGYKPKRPGGKIPKVAPKPLPPKPLPPKPLPPKPLPPKPLPPTPTPGGTKPTEEKKSKFPNSKKDYDSKEKASLDSAIKSNQKELESVRQAVIKNSEDTLKEIDSAKSSIAESEAKSKEIRVKTKSLREEAEKHLAENNTKKYIETKRILDEEYTKLGSLERNIEEQQKKIKIANEKARQIGFSEIRKDMLAINKQDGFSSEQLNKATEELKKKQETAIANDKQSLKDGSLSYVKERRGAAQEALREICNPNIHSESLTRPVQYWNKGRADSTATIVEFVDGTRSSTGGGIRVKIDTEIKTYMHEYGHQIEDGNPEVKDLCREFLDKRTSGEKIEKFQKTMPGYGYRRYEKGSADNFGKAHAEIFPELNTNNRAYYTGKRYDDTPFGKSSKYIGATEVYSMGMELLHRNPAKFAKVDPEWFDLVTGIATGRLLKKTRGVEQ